MSAAGLVFDTDTRRIEAGSRPPLSAADRMRRFICVRFSAIDMAGESHTACMVCRSSYSSVIGRPITFV